MAGWNQEVGMKPRIIACSVLIGALAAGANAYAQSESGSLSASGTGFTLPQRAGPPAMHSLSGLRLDTSEAEAWWGFARADTDLQVGMSVGPRLGTGYPVPAPGFGERVTEPVEVGPGLKWLSPAGLFTASFRFDPTGVTQGDALRLSFSRPLISSQGFRLLAYVGAEWQSGRTASITPGLGETTNIRPLYSTGSAANVGFGLDTHYQLTRSSAIVVGASGLRFGGAPVEGALYADRWQATLYGGYSFRF
jgi:MltA-interacting protein MipA